MVMSCFCRVFKSYWIIKFYGSNLHEKGWWDFVRFRYFRNVVGYIVEVVWVIKDERSVVSRRHVIYRMFGQIGQKLLKKSAHLAYKTKLFVSGNKSNIRLHEVKHKMNIAFSKSAVSQWSIKKVREFSNYIHDLPRDAFVSSPLSHLMRISFKRQILFPVEWKYFQ